MFKLNKSDFAKGAATAVIAAVFMALYSIVTQTGFNLFTTDWNAVFVVAVNSAFAAFVGYMGKNFLSNDQGKVLGKIG